MNTPQNSIPSQSQRQPLQMEELSRIILEDDAFADLYDPDIDAELDHFRDSMH
ncbi:hypothetical protein [Amantichitinum ursilacus]|uniref:Uncharacterized protein n=1 Tax=Amantichitinum ursilacus TaxID=857265 RepID=A0A0N0XJ69_9NEIS|nr:hypothetical protein [Amantichitinum ursilacus]KPC50448.1 hypothetical protein WG78_17610 [Amantichitinum ursilacus]